MIHSKVLFSIERVAQLDFNQAKEFPLNQARLDETIQTWLQEYCPDAPFPFANGVAIKDVGYTRYFVERTDNFVAIKKIEGPYPYMECSK